MSDSKLYPEWIIGFDPGMDHQYMIHTHHPRFICAIEQHPFLSDTDLMYELNNQYVLNKFVWLDQAPDLEEGFMPLMAHAQAAFDEFDTVESSMLEYEAVLPPIPPAPSLN